MERMTAKSRLSVCGRLKKGGSEFVREKASYKPADTESAPLPSDPPYAVHKEYADALHTSPGIS